MRYLIVAYCALISPVFAQSNQATQQGTFVVQTYINTCARFPGNNSQISTFVKENQYVRANEQFSKAALRGEAGEVWGVPNTIGQFLVVLSGQYNCSVWARTADVRTVNEGFEKIVKGLARPGLRVEPKIDKVSDGVGGQYRQLGYFIQKDGAPYGWIMLATTSESPSAEVQVRLTMSPSKQ